jgi:hypothetical protein
MEQIKTIWRTVIYSAKQITTTKRGNKKIASKKQIMTKGDQKLGSKKGENKYLVYKTNLDYSEGINI